MSALSDLGQYLETAGIAVQETDLFLGSLPDYPDHCLCIYQYSGGMPDYIQDSFTPSVEKPQIQVVARDLRYEVAEALAYQAWMSLAAINNATLSGTRYLNVRPNGSPALMRRDTNDRLLVSFNATVEKEVSVVPAS